MRTRSFEHILEQGYDRRDATWDMPRTQDVGSHYAEPEGYELGRRDGTMCGLLIGSISGAITMLAASMLF